MRFLSLSKDGGPESRVWAYTLIELKWLFTIVLLRFDDGSREAYHNHTFNALSWLLSGVLHEDEKTSDSFNGHVLTRHYPSFAPILTLRSTLHMVRSVGTSWVLSFRGPWSSTWREYIPATGETITLTNGRREVREATGALRDDSGRNP